MVNIIERPERLSVLILLFVLTVQGCRSSDQNRAPEESVPALHHPPRVSPAPSSDARLMEGMGKVDFPITTKSKEAQAFFNQGVAQLYGFWFVEAVHSFVQATKLDPGAAMAYWGIAMAANGNFIPAYQLTASPTPRLPVVVPADSPEQLARPQSAKPSLCVIP